MKRSHSLFLLGALGLASASFAALAGTNGAPANAPAKSTDPAAEALLQQVAGKIRSLKSVSAEFLYVYPHAAGQQGSATAGTLKLMRPNLARIEVFRATFDPTAHRWTRQAEVRTQASNGESYWTYTASTRQFRKDTPDPAGANIHSDVLAALPDFFSPDASYLGEVQAAQKRGSLRELVLEAPQAWEGGTYRVVRFATAEGSGDEATTRTERLFIGRDDLVHREQGSLLAGKDRSEWETDLHNLRANVPTLTRTAFAYAPPAGASEAGATQVAGAPDAGPPAPDAQAPADGDEPALLKNGTVAPDFTVKDGTGHDVKLSDFKGKVVVLDFWATWCEPCQYALEHLRDVAKKYAGKNVAFLAVNVLDQQDAFDKWLPEHKDMDAIRFAIDPTPDQKDVGSKLYNVSGLPTQYVIGTDGKIVASVFGFNPDGTDLEDALHKAGVE